MSEKTIFKRIIDGEIDAEIIYEDDLCMAFKDISAQAPTHFLMIPKKEIKSIDTFADSESGSEDEKIAGHMLLSIAKIARKLGVDQTGYRVVTNIGKDGGQSVFHLHFHVLAGRKLKWPPG